MTKTKTGKLSAAASGEFKLGGDLKVHRLGFGAMRITGDGVWGEPKDPAAMRKVLRAAVDLGITLIDTADSYGPEVSERLIAEALHPYPKGLVIATKGGLTRQGPNLWLPVGRPEYLQQCVEMSLRRLKVDCIDLYQLHRIDPKVPAAETLGALNMYNLSERKSAKVLDYCTEHQLGFIPWFPLAAGKIARPGGPLDKAAKQHGATVSQLALAWLLQSSPVVLPIPGTSSVEHLKENVGGAAIKLTVAEWEEIGKAK